MLELDFTNIRSLITKVRWSEALKLELINETSFLPLSSPISERLYCIYAKLTKLPVCENCSKPVKFHKFPYGYNRFCSSACRNSSPVVKNQRKLTNINRYGGNTPTSSKRIRRKIQATNLKKYGCTNPSQSEEIKQKKRNTLLKNYGVENPSLCESIQEKKKQTCLKKYGYTHWLKDTNAQKKFSETLLASHFKRKIERLKHIVEPMFDLTTYKGVFRSNKYPWKCVICQYQFLDEIDDGKIPQCPICVGLVGTRSRAENDLYDFLQEILSDYKITRNNRRLISPLELDFLIPDLKIAIEFNGVYWHSELKIKDTLYHLKKTTQCASIDYQLIHIFDNEWLLAKDIVKSRLKAILGVEQNKIYARNCVIREIDTKTKNAFLEENHIQRSCASSINYGLFYNDELVSVMTFGKPRFSKEYDWEMIRYCSRLNTRIVGGASKLLSAFEKQNNPKNLISYADRRWSCGKLYEQLDFELLRTSQPNYFYFHSSNKIVLLESRNTYQKHKLPAILKTFDPNKTEWENMKDNGYNRIWDCGNWVFLKEYNQ